MSHSTIRSINDPEVRDTISQTSSSPRSYHPSPSAWEDQVLYFLLPDRFATGKEGTAIEPYTSAFNSNATSSPEDASSWREAGITWQGGTLQGIKSKLGYLKRMGVTAVWIGPIFKQVPHEEHSYHGYAVQNFLDIDPHFGTREDLKELVQAAHAEGLYIILDIILNHSGDVFEYRGGRKDFTGSKYEAQGFRDAHGNPTLPFAPLNPQAESDDVVNSAIWPAELQTPSTFTREGKITNWDAYPEYLRGDFETLKDIDLGDDCNPGDPSGSIDDFTPSPALETLCEVYKFWIAYADLDGYRIDTVKHMGDGPTRHLCTSLHEYASTLSKHNFFLVGEVTGPRAYAVVAATGLDAALGIGNVQAALWTTCKGVSAPDTYFSLFRNASYLKQGSDAWLRNKLVTMLDDHDQVWRGGDKARFCADATERDLAVAALALNLTTLGIPCVYYGTEQLFDGAGGSDRYIREAMFGGTFGAFRSHSHHFFNEDTSTYRQISQICALRNKYLALRRGRQYLREISANGTEFGYPTVLGGGRMRSVVAWSRILADQELLCAMNTDTEQETRAYVTVDAKLYKKGDYLKLVYDSSGGHAQAQVQILEANGKALLLAVPPAAFVIYG
ncbi:alpha-amylase [Bimuria novae-zelandiae CBS 107.79]|uniref:Alpha-amylase n=1 Tax=Bimuria novae-zelandiae CBS 107.79 TaxID=1447943 RepID=A0A6A5USE2_9PLEO|nr:alpha-amylase [Bimuria novae-zelandiae CBS 107.79]